MAHYTQCNGKLPDGQPCDMRCTKELNILNLGSEAAVESWWCAHFVPNCPKCTGCLVKEEVLSHKMPYNRLRCTSCHSVLSNKTGTAFDGMRISIFDIVATMAMFVQGDRIASIVERIKLAEETVQEIIARITKLYLAHNFLQYAMEAGTADEVQADETAVGARKYNKGARRRKNGVMWVAGFCRINEERVKSMVAHVVVSRTIEDLVPMIAEATTASAKITTDCWKAYVFDAQRNHQTVNHSKTFKDEDTGAHTNGCEGMWTWMKNQIKRRWGRVGTEDLNTSNLRIQAGIFFVNHSLQKTDPLQATLQLLLDHIVLMGVLDVATKLEQEEEARTLAEAEATSNPKKKHKKEVIVANSTDAQHNKLIVLANAFFQHGKAHIVAAATAAEPIQVPFIEDDNWGPGTKWFHKDPSGDDELGAVTVVTCTARMALVEAGDGTRHKVKRATLRALQELPTAKDNKFAFGVNFCHAKFGEVTVTEQKKTSVRVRIMSNGKFITIYKKDLKAIGKDTVTAPPTPAVATPEPDRRALAALPQNAASRGIDEQPISFGAKPITIVNFSSTPEPRRFPVAAGPSACQYSDNLPECDIYTVMAQAQKCRDTAIAALRANKGDVVGAILALQED